MTPASATARATAPAPARRPAPRRAPAVPAPRPTRPRPHLRVVAERRRRRRIRLAVVGAVGLSLFLVFGLVAFNVLLVQSQFELERLEQQVEVEREEYERLRLEAAKLSSPDRILNLAREELGMVDPEAVTHLVAPSSPDDRGVEGSARAWTEVKPYLAAEP